MFGLSLAVLHDYEGARASMTVRVLVYGRFVLKQIHFDRQA